MMTDTLPSAVYVRKPVGCWPAGFVTSPFSVVSVMHTNRYVYPSEDAVLDAISRLGGHKIGHSENAAPLLPVATATENAVQ